MLTQLIRSQRTQLVLAMVLVVLCIGWGQPYVSRLLSNDPELLVTATPEGKDTASVVSENTEQASGTTVQDPFKAHLASNGPNTKFISFSAPATQSASTQLGADPFKAFIDQQKKMAKEASISPFGK
jgi:hypothetical protein